MLKALLYTGIAASFLLLRSFFYFVYALIYDARHRPYSPTAAIVIQFFYALLTPTVCAFLLLVAFQPEWTGKSTKGLEFVGGNSQPINPVQTPELTMNNRYSYNNPGQPMVPSGYSQNSQYNYDGASLPTAAPVNNQHAQPVPTRYQPWN